MEKYAKGAWIIHNGRKIQNSTGGGAEYSAIDIAAKSASLLARMSRNDEVTLTADQVKVAARAGGLNPKTELRSCLDQLKDQSVIAESEDGSVTILGVTVRTTLLHAENIFKNNEPSAYEKASLELGEFTSSAPVKRKHAAEFIGDTCKLTHGDMDDFLNQAAEIGFVDHEADGCDPILFNGNLFRRDTARKTERIMSSLSGREATLTLEFSEKLNKQGAIPSQEAEKMLGDTLMSKLRAAGVFDENVVANERGEHSFITAPGAFHKYANPLAEDAFDQAKALVAALGHMGMSASPERRGRIFSISLLLRKMLNGREVGSAPAIGQDYRALELEGVVTIRRDGYRCYMSLQKMDVGQIAYDVLTQGDATATVIDKFPGASMTSYQNPEASRTKFRQKKQTEPSRKHTRDLLSTLRSHGGL